LEIQRRFGAPTWRFAAAILAIKEIVEDENGMQKIPLKMTNLPLPLRITEEAAPPLNS
jgi:hypothetical protein